MRVLQVSCIIALAAPLFAQQSATIDLTGVRFQNGLNQSRSSAPNTISPSFAYSYAVTGNVQGSGVVLGLLVPTPTPIAEVLESLAPGSSALLSGEIYNQAGTHPAGVFNESFSESQVLFGIPVTAGATLSAGIGADNVMSFNITNVVLTPAALVGSLQFTSGSATVTRIAVAAGDLDFSGAVNFLDIDPFIQALFDPTAYEAAFGHSALFAGDVNRDGAVNFLDIDPFIDVLFP